MAPFNIIQNQFNATEFSSENLFTDEKERRNSSYDEKSNSEDQSSGVQMYADMKDSTILLKTTVDLDTIIETKI